MSHPEPRIAPSAASLEPSALSIATRYIGVASNAAYFGVASIAIPLALLDNGFAKLEIAGYFAIGSVAGAVMNAVIGPMLRRAGFPWWGILVPNLCGVLALSGLSAVDSIWQALPLGIALGSLTLVFPFFVGLSSAHGDENGARIAGNLRTSFVAGYVAGLAS